MNESTTISITKGTSLNIPKSVAFRFRNDGKINLVAIIVTIPPWLENQEPIISNDSWNKKIS